MKIKNSMMYKFIFCLKGGLSFFFFSFLFWVFSVEKTIELLYKEIQDL